MLMRDDFSHIDEAAPLPTTEFQERREWLHTEVTGYRGSGTANGAINENLVADLIWDTLRTIKSIMVPWAECTEYRKICEKNPQDISQHLDNGFVVTRQPALEREQNLVERGTCGGSRRYDFDWRINQNTNAVFEVTGTETHPNYIEKRAPSDIARMIKSSATYGIYVITGGARNKSIKYARRVYNNMLADSGLTETRRKRLAQNVFVVSSDELPALLIKLATRTRHPRNK